MLLLVYHSPKRDKRRRRRSFLFSDERGSLFPVKIFKIFAHSCSGWLPKNCSPDLKEVRERPEQTKVFKYCLLHCQGEKKAAQAEQHAWCDRLQLSGTATLLEARKCESHPLAIFMSGFSPEHTSLSQHPIKVPSQLNEVWLYTAQRDKTMNDVMHNTLKEVISWASSPKCDETANLIKWWHVCICTSFVVPFVSV